MNKLLKKFRGNEKGFTLIELIIVIAILAVISALAIPNILTAVNNAKKTTDVANAKIIADSVASIKARTDEYSSQTYDALDLSSVTGSGDDGFANALFTEMNSKIPTPSYKTVPDGYSGTIVNYILQMDANGTIRIYVGNGAVELTDGASPANDIMIFPTPDDMYSNK